MTKRSYRTKVISYTSASITAVCIISILAFVLIFSSKERHKLKDHLDILLDIKAEFLAKPLWGLDKEEIENFLRATSSNDRISYVGVWTKWGNETELFGEHGHDVVGDYAIAGERGIFQPGNHEAIGRLKLILSGEYVQFTIRAIWWVGFLIGSVVVGISVGVVFLGFHVFTRPLRALTLTMERLSDRDVDVDIPSLDRPDEIGDMARSIRQFKANAIKVDAMTDELRQHALRLEESLDREKALNALQRQFVSMVSHEFRTPLAIIDSSAGRLKKGAQTISPETLMPWVDKIKATVVRMTHLIEGSLSASRLDEGKVLFEPEECAIAALIMDVQESLVATKDTHQFAIDLEPLPPLILGDPKLLHQVFVNLISNAMKYSPPGSTITIEGSSDQTSVIISVRDQGVGIPEDEIGNLFERFFRASTSAGIPGTGIGLYVVKSFLEMHGGSISVESAPNGGTCFTAKFPIGRDVDTTSASEETVSIDELIGIDERLFSGA